MLKNFYTNIVWNSSKYCLLKKTGFQYFKKINRPVVKSRVIFFLKLTKLSYYQGNSNIVGSTPMIFSTDLNHFTNKSKPFFKVSTVGYFNLKHMLSNLLKDSLVFLKPSVSTSISFLKGRKTRITKMSLFFKKNYIGFFKKIIDQSYNSKNKFKIKSLLGYVYSDKRLKELKVLTGQFNILTQRLV